MKKEVFKPDGGPAFPYVDRIEKDQFGHYSVGPKGASTRQWYKTMIVQGLIAALGSERGLIGGRETLQRAIIDTASEMADKMLDEDRAFYTGVFKETDGEERTD